MTEKKTEPLRKTQLRSLRERYGVKTYEIDVPVEGSVTYQVKARSLKEALKRADKHDFDARHTPVLFNNWDGMVAALSNGNGIWLEGEDESLPWREVRQAWDEMTDEEVADV